MHIIIIILFINIFLSDLSNNINDKLIISLMSNPIKINNIESIIYSILKQNVDCSLYKILLILSKNDFVYYNIPENIIILEKANKLRILLVDKKLDSQSRLIYTMKEYPNSPILLISDNIIFPYGWLNMFINDHKKYFLIKLLI